MAISNDPINGKSVVPTALEPTPPPQSDAIIQFFAYDHLPLHLQLVSKPFGDLARLVERLPRNAERTVALRRLLESKDAAVRAALYKEE